MSDEITVQGVIEEQGFTTYQYGSHVLVGARRYALRSDTIDLSRYIGQQVEVTGTLMPDYPLSGGPPYLNVTAVR